MRAFTTITALSLAARFLSVRAQALVSTGSNGSPCLVVPTVTVQPFYFSSYIAGPTIIYNFNGNGDNITINNGDTTLITSGYVTVTATITVSNGNSNVISPILSSTTNKSSAAGSTTTTTNPGVSARSTTRFSAVPPPSATVTGAAATYTIATTDSANRTITSTVVQPELQLGQGLPNGTVSSVPTETPFMLAYAYSPYIQKRALADAVGFQQSEGQSGSSGQGCGYATRFTLQNGRLSSNANGNTVGRNTTDSYALISPWPFANDVADGFYLVNGMLAWNTSDLGPATFYACGSGPLYAGFPSPPFSNCSVVTLGGVAGSACPVDYTGDSNNSAPGTASFSTSTDVAQSSVSQTQTITTTSAAPTASTEIQYCPQYNFTTAPADDQTYEIYCDYKLAGQDIQPFYPDGYSAQDVTDFNSCIDICNAWNEQEFQGYCVGVTYVGPGACYPYAVFQGDAQYARGNNAARLIWEEYPQITDAPSSTTRTTTSSSQSSSPAVSLTPTATSSIRTSLSPTSSVIATSYPTSTSSTIISTRSSSGTATTTLPNSTVSSLASVSSSTIRSVTTSSTLVLSSPSTILSTLLSTVNSLATSLTTGLSFSTSGLTSALSTSSTEVRTFPKTLSTATTRPTMTTSLSLPGTSVVSNTILSSRTESSKVTSLTSFTRSSTTSSTANILSPVSSIVTTLLSTSSQLTTTASIPGNLVPSSSFSSSITPPSTTSTSSLPLTFTGFLSTGSLSSSQTLTISSSLATTLSTGSSTTSSGLTISSSSLSSSTTSIRGTGSSLTSTTTNVLTTTTTTTTSVTSTSAPAATTSTTATTVVTSASATTTSVGTTTTSNSITTSSTAATAATTTTTAGATATTTTASNGNGSCVNGAAPDRTYTTANGDVYGICLNTDFAGVNLGGAVSGTTPEQCADLCSAAVGCIGASLLRSTAQCYLKNIQNVPVTKSGVDSVYKISSGNAGGSGTTTSGATSASTTAATTTTGNCLLPSYTSSPDGLVPLPAYCPTYDGKIIENTQYLRYDYQLYCDADIGGTDIFLPSGFTEVVTTLTQCIDACNYWNANSDCIVCEAVVYLGGANCFPKTNIYVQPRSGQFNYYVAGHTAAIVLDGKYPSPTATKALPTATTNITTATTAASTTTTRTSSTLTTTTTTTTTSRASPILSVTNDSVE